MKPEHDPRDELGIRKPAQPPVDPKDTLPSGIGAGICAQCKGTGKLADGLPCPICAKPGKG